MSDDGKTGNVVNKLEAQSKSTRVAGRAGKEVN